MLDVGVRKVSPDIVRLSRHDPFHIKWVVGAIILFSGSGMNSEFREQGHPFRVKACDAVRSDRQVRAGKRSARAWAARIMVRASGEKENMQDHEQGEREDVVQRPSFAKRMQLLCHPL